MYANEQNIKKGNHVLVDRSPFLAKRAHTLRMIFWTSAGVEYPNESPHLLHMGL